MAAVTPKHDDTISYDTLKRLIGAAQARNIWAQKQVAELGILFDDQALEAMRRVISRDQLPQPGDVRIAAPAVVAYLREAYPGVRSAAFAWVARRLKLGASPNPEDQVKAKRKRGHYQVVRLMKPEFVAERDEAIAMGMGFCVNHPTKEERIQPRENFTRNKDAPGQLSYRCRDCQNTLQKQQRAERAASSNLTPPQLAARMQGLSKAHEILIIARRLRGEGLSHEAAMAAARREWATQHPNGADQQSNGQAATEPAEAELPPLPEDSERPYEEGEPELVTANSGQEVQS